MTIVQPETNFAQMPFGGDWQAWEGHYFTTKRIGQGRTPLDAIRDLLDREDRAKPCTTPLE